MPVSMFTTKIESSHCWPTSAVRPSATTIETIARMSGSVAATTRAEDEQQDDQRRRQPEAQLALLEVALRDLVEVAVDRVVAGHVHGEAVAAVRLLDDGDQLLDRLLLVRRELDRDEHRVAVLRDRGPRPRTARRRSRPAARRAVESASRRAPRRPAGRPGRRALRSSLRIDHELGRLVLGGSALRSISRSACTDSGLFVTVASLVSPPPSSVADEHEGDDDRGDPRADRPPGVRGGGAGEALGHATVVTDRFAVVTRLVASASWGRRGAPVRSSRWACRTAPRGSTSGSGSPVAPDEAGRLAAKLAGDGVEAVVLSTCNRTEIYLAGRRARPARAKWAARRSTSARGSRSRPSSWSGAAPTRRSISSASRRGSTRSFPARRRSSARCARRTSSRSRPGRRAGSSRARSSTRSTRGSACGTRPASGRCRPRSRPPRRRSRERTVGNLAGKRVLVIGAGKMGELAATSFLDRGAERVFVANHRIERADRARRPLRRRGGGVRPDPRGARARRRRPLARRAARR